MRRIVLALALCLAFILTACIAEPTPASAPPSDEAQTPVPTVA